MTRRDKGGVLCGLALPLLLAAGYCFYKGLDPGITAEEGLRYSLPAMKADPRYSKQDILYAEADFKKLEHLGDEWSDAFAACAFLAVITGGAGIWMLWSARKKHSAQISGPLN